MPLLQNDFASCLDAEVRVPKPPQCLYDSLSSTGTSDTPTGTAAAPVALLQALEMASLNLAVAEGVTPARKAGAGASLWQEAQLGQEDKVLFVFFCCC